MRRIQLIICALTISMQTHVSFTTVYLMHQHRDTIWKSKFPYITIFQLFLFHDPSWYGINVKCQRFLDFIGAFFLWRKTYRFYSRLISIVNYFLKLVLGNLASFRDRELKARCGSMEQLSELLGESIKTTVPLYVLAHFDIHIIVHDWRSIEKVWQAGFKYAERIYNHGIIRLPYLWARHLQCVRHLRTVFIGYFLWESIIGNAPNRLYWFCQ